MAHNTTSTSTFVTVVGLFPMTDITPAMAAAINSVDDDGALTGSAQTLNKLVRYGLAEDRRIRGVFLTNAGWGVFGRLAPTPKHDTETRVVGESRLNWRKARMESSRAAAWSCTCGASGWAEDRDNAQRAARQHRAG